MQELQQQVIQVISEQLGIEAAKISASSNFIDDLGADSLDTVELIMAFEEEFEVEIPDEVAEQIKTVQDVMQLIGDRKAA